MNPAIVARNTALTPALNIVRCAASCASSPTVRDNPSINRTEERQTAGAEQEDGEPSASCGA
jgi:hypothetical protein